jgi:hypothetical protein
MNEVGPACGRFDESIPPAADAERTSHRPPRLDDTLPGVYPSRLSVFRRDGRVVEGAPLLRA